MVRIIGGGFSGLTLAEALLQRNIPFELFEASSRLGGMIQTEKLSHGLSESAANGLLWSPELQALSERLGISLLEAHKKSRVRWIYSKGRPRRWPLGLGATAKLAGALIKFRINPEGLKPLPGESLRVYGLKHLGLEATEKLLKPALQGVYGSSFEQLSASLILGKFFEPNRPQVKPRTVSFEGGLQTLISSLSQKIQKQNSVFLGKTVSLNDLNPNVGPIVICTNLKATAGLVGSLLSPMPAASSGLISVTVLARISRQALKGFGCLFSDLKESKGALGVLFNSEIFPGRASAGYRSETWILEASSLSDQGLLTLIQDLRENLFGESEAILEHKVWRWNEAIPVYSAELESWLQKIGPFGEVAFSGSPIRLHGNYGGEIGLSSILRRSQQLADKIAGMI